MANSENKAQRFRIKTHTKGFQLSEALLDLLEAEIAKAGLNAQLASDSDMQHAEIVERFAQSVTLNFRDSSYSATSGGYHPVEISISRDGELIYVTDFSYVGVGDYAELERELDFDFVGERFWHFSNAYKLAAGRAMFDLWQTNFCSYFKWAVFEVEVTVL